MYKFTFASVGGATRVRIQSGEDIRHLGELDKKMWTVLSCPTTGLEIDSESLSLMDSDKDGQLHVEEVIRASEWLCTVLKDPQSLLEGKAEITISNIADNDIAAVAQKISKDVITLADVDKAIADIKTDEQAAPDAPYPANVIAAYKTKQAEYADYYEQEKLQALGLTRISEETAKPGMTEEEFKQMGDKIAAYETAAAAAAEANTKAMDEAKSIYAPLRKLLLLHRDFAQLLRNYVTLEDFYNKDRKAIFQAGTLYIDQRACHLCIRISDMSKHDSQAPQSGMYLVYCDCINKKTGKTMKIVAALTMGDVQNISVGKNAVFYDRNGLDYDATVYKIIENPISIRQAFWSPYRRIAKWAEDLINKRASEKDSQIMAETTAKLETTDLKSGEQKPTQPFDIAKFAGIFAAIGMALGMIGSALVAVASGFRALTWWQAILVIIAILLLISGPSMIMAAIKLRRRDLAPLLNANGWAVNAATIVNILFGATLTDQVKFPLVKMKDPFKKKGLPAWAVCLIVIGCLAAVVCVLWLCNLLAWAGCASPLGCC